MHQLLTFIVKHITQHPDEVVVTEMLTEDGQNVTLGLSVNPEDMGMVIGKEGSTARALRNLMKVSAMKHNQRVYIDILEAGSADTSDSSTEATTATE